MRAESIGKGVTRPDLSVLIVNWNVARLLEKCIGSVIQNSDGLTFDMVVIDNASEGSGFQKVKKRFSWQPNITWIENDRNIGCLAENQALPLCRGKYLLLLGPDVTVLPSAFRKMVEFLEKEERAGAVSAKLLNTDMSPQNYYFSTWTLSMCFFSTGIGKLLDRALAKRRFERRYFGEGIDSTKLTEVEQAPGACFMLRWGAVMEDYLVDEDFPFFFNDADLCKRIHDNGYKIFLLPQARVIHDQSAAYKKADSHWRDEEYRRSAIKYFQKHHKSKVPGVRMIFLLEKFTRFLLYTINAWRSPRRKSEGLSNQP